MLSLTYNEKERKVVSDNMIHKCGWDWKMKHKKKPFIADLIIRQIKGGKFYLFFLLLKNGSVYTLFIKTDIHIESIWWT